jgi:HEAT repeat protein
MNRILALTAPAMICASLISAADAPMGGEEDRAMSILADALKSRNPETRKAGVKALRLVGEQEPFATRLEGMLHDGDVPVRVAAVEALAELKNQRAIAALKTALSDQVPEVRYAAATALFNLHQVAGREFLIGVLNGHQKTCSGMVAEHIREARRTLEIPDALLTLAVERGTAFVPVPYFDAGIEAFKEIRAHNGVSSRASTAALLGKERDSRVIAALRVALTDKQPAVRAAAARSLALADDPAVEQDAAGLFVPLFKDRHLAVRLTAAAGYLRSEKAAVAAADVVDE